MPLQASESAAACLPAFIAKPNFHSDGMLSDKTKMFCVKPCKQSELDFYQTTPSCLALGPFLALFYGELNQGVTAEAAAAGATALNAPALVPQNGPVPSAPNRIAPVPNGITPALDAGLPPPMLTPGAAFPGPAAAMGIPRPTVAPAATPAKVWHPSKGAPIEAERHIVLSNEEHGFARPNVLDVKLGARLWADDAPPAKRQRLDAVAAATTSGPLGFRIAGMKVWGGEAAEAQELATGGFSLHGKAYGRDLTPETVRRGFEEFFFVEGAEVRGAPARKIVRRFVDDLRALAQVLEGLESRMYSSSLLFVYEGDGELLREKFLQEKEMMESMGSLQGGDAGADAGVEGVDSIAIGAENANGIGQDESGASEDTDGSSDDAEHLPKLQTLKLIDFAHATWTPGEGPDENALHGIRSVIGILEELVAQHV